VNYADVFADGLGWADKLQDTINTGNAVPIRQSTLAAQ